MAETFDIAIVGAGITGCAIARQLARYDLSICVVEAANDIALGASKANGGLVHAGYDPAPGTVKAQVNARGCGLYGTWAQELGFLFRRTGSMVLGFDDEDRAHLERLRRNGHVNGVPELSIVGPDRIHELEPRASADATCALWCPSTGFVDPFEVAIAALENAVANGVTFMRSASVEAIEVAGSGDDARFTLATPAGNVRCRYLINAAGNGAADISHMAGAEEFQMVWRQGNIVVLDKEPRTLMPLYPVPTPVSKGVIVTGTVHGNTVITATTAVREPGDTQTYASDVNALLTGARKLVPDLETRRVVRAFAGGRPVIQGTNDFFIGQSAVVPGLFQAAGIQSPGVASAPAIAERMELVMRGAGVELRERADWDPIRRAPDDFDLAPLARKEELIESDPAWGQIVCRCETVPEAEIVAAIRRRPGAVSVEGVYELMPYANGLRRNVKNCLDDFGIPLHLSTTVTRVIGHDRVEAVEVSQVDEHLAPIAGTERIVPCDTLLLSVGLIPENELSVGAGVELDPRTRGAVVDQSLQTGVPGIFACGNVLHVHDLADNVTTESERAGAAAAAWALGTGAGADMDAAGTSCEAGASCQLTVSPAGIAGYALPGRITAVALTKLNFRVRRPVDAARVRILADGEELLAGKVRAFKPSVMESFPLPAKVIQRALDLGASEIVLSVDPVEEA